MRCLILSLIILVSLISLAIGYQSGLVIAKYQLEHTKLRKLIQKEKALKQYFKAGGGKRYLKMDGIWAVRLGHLKHNKFATLLAQKEQAELKYYKGGNKK